MDQQQVIPAAPALDRWNQRRRRRTMPWCTVRWTVLALLATLGQAAAQAQPGGANAEPYFEGSAAHPVPQALREANLETPQACVEHFVRAAQAKDWRVAAAALDYRLIEDVDAGGAARFAERFHYVLNQELWIDWDLLPDRADGVLNASPLRTEQQLTGEARRSIRLGSIQAGGRSIPVNVHRVKIGESAPVWLFSAHTVDNIDLFWEIHGPSWLARQMPEWAKKTGALRIPAWQWIGLLVTVLLAPLLGFITGLRVCQWIAKLVPKPLGDLVESLKWPMSATIASMIVWATFAWVLGLPGHAATVLEPVALTVFVAALVWLCMRTVTYLVDRVVKGTIRDHHEEESESRRRLLTQVTVARHVSLFALALIGLAIVLLQLDTFRAVGITLLTSAGAAAVILGIAGHAVLGNLIAGLHIALAQPFRIGDTVFVEDNWGRIEDVSYVDVVVRTWDHRRLVFPIRYFVSNWFENWSKTDGYLVKAIYLKVDYRADVAAIRKQFEDLVRRDDDWAEDRDEPEVLVTDCSDETMTVRLTCGSPDPSRAWSLECRVREKMLDWLRTAEGGRYLPRQRLVLTEDERAGQRTAD